MRTGSSIHAVRLLRFVFFLCLALLTLSHRSQAQHSSAAGASKKDSNRALIEAIYNGDKAQVTALLDTGADVNARDAMGRTPLQWAMEYSQRDIMQLLRRRGASIGLLREAAALGERETVREMLDNGAKVDGRDRYGQTALFAAAAWGFTEIAQLLLERGADVNLRDKAGETALMKAASHSHGEIVRLLRSHGANIDAADSLGMTALMQALWWDHPFLAAGLLDLGADATRKDRRGRTAMALAAPYGNMNLIKDLEKHGAHLDVLDAILLRDKPKALTLLKGRVDLHARGPYGETPLMAAAERGYAGVVRALLEQGANPNGQEDDGLTPLVLALGGRVQHGQIGTRLTGDPEAPQRREIVRDLVNAGAKINQRIRFRDFGKSYFITPLQWAIQISPLEEIRFLLDSGADVNIAGDTGRTPLMTTWAGISHLLLDFKPRPEVTQWLLDLGADVNREDDEGKTALMYCPGDTEMMRQLRDRGANLKHRNHRGQTVLALTAAEHEAKSLDWLLAQGMDIHEHDRYGWTLLTYAARNGNQERIAQLKQQGFQVGIMDALFMHDVAKVNELLDKGENPNRREPYERSLLSWAVDRKDADIVAMLLKHGADVHKKPYEGISPLRMAQIYRRDDIVEMLVKAGAE